MSRPASHLLCGKEDIYNELFYVVHHSESRVGHRNDCTASGNSLMGYSGKLLVILFRSGPIYCRQLAPDIMFCSKAG